jgi:hypothetical protein
MKYIIILLILLGFISCSQSISNNDPRLIGDWYYFSGKENIYTEIYFKNSITQWTTRFSDTSPRAFKTKNDSIYLKSFNNEFLEQSLVAKLEIKEINNISLHLDTITFSLYKIDDSKYTYSQYSKDNESLSKMDESQRDLAFQIIARKQFTSFRKRETFARLDHKLITKSEIIDYCEDCIEKEVNNQINLDFCTKLKHDVENRYE